MTDDIAYLARIAYSTGIDPITYATDHVIQSHVEIYLAVRDFGSELGVSPSSMPVLSTAALSRRILGDLMDAGWIPPEVAK